MTKQVFLAGLLALQALAASATTLTGRVVNNQSGVVLGGAEVAVASTAASADAGGFFRLLDVAPGPALLRVKLADGSRFSVRLVIPDSPRYFVELDQARHGPPEADDEY